MEEPLTCTSVLESLQIQSGLKPSFEDEPQEPLQGFIFTEKCQGEK